MEQVNNPDQRWNQYYIPSAGNGSGSGNGNGNDSTPPNSTNVNTPSASSTSSSRPLLRQQDEPFTARRSSAVPTTGATFYPTGYDYFDTPYTSSSGWAEEPLTPPEQSPALRPQDGQNINSRVTSASHQPSAPSGRAESVENSRRSSISVPSTSGLPHSLFTGGPARSGSTSSSTSPPNIVSHAPPPPPPPSIPLDIDDSYTGKLDPEISPIVHSGPFASPSIPFTPVSPIANRRPSLSRSKQGSQRQSRLSRTDTLGFKAMSTVKEGEVIDTSYDPGFYLTRSSSAESATNNTYSERGLEYDAKNQEELVFIEEGEGTGGWVKRNAKKVLPKRFGTYKAVHTSDRLGAHKLRGSKTSGEVEESFHGIDFSSFDSPIPMQTQQAMEDMQGSADFAYTEKGEVIDISSLQGLLGEWRDIDNEMSDTVSLRSTTTGPQEKSYYFPEDKEMPNWKPFTMRTTYLVILMTFSAGIIACIELLYQLSVLKGKKYGKGPFLASFMDAKELSLPAYALWKYVPTVVAVVYGVMTQCTDAEVKRVEPYYQLSRRPKGALAAHSLNIEYLSFLAIFSPVQAMRHRHWAVVLSSLMSILSVIALPPLQSAFLQVNPSVKVRRENPHIEKTIVVDPVFSRILEACLGLVFLSTLTLWVVIYRRKTGLVGDPSGIAGVAAMANKSHILMDFKDLDEKSEDEIHKQLNKRTYILHKSSLWQGEYLKKSERMMDAPKAQNAHPLLLRLKAGIPFVGYLVFVMGMLPLIFFEKSLSGILVKTPWLLTAVSVSIKSLWDVIDRDLRILEPFWLLYRRHAHPSVLTLDYTATIPGWLVAKAAANHHYLLAFVGFISIMTEILTICVGSLDAKAGEDTDLAAAISLGLSELILVLILCGCGIVYSLRRDPFLPRQPGTISSVLAFIHQSWMLTDFGGTERLTTDERRRKLEALGKSYGFGWFKGRDGQRHCGIDQEELESSYTFGVSLKDGILEGPGMVGGWERY